MKQSSYELHDSDNHFSKEIERHCMNGLNGLRVIFGALHIAISIAFLTGTPRAEEAGMGHYVPGATSSFIDMLPDRDSFAFVYANAFTYYNGSTGASKDLELGGLLTANVKATAYSETSFFLFQTPWKILNGQYGAALIVPYVWLNVQGDVLLGGRHLAVGTHKEDAANGFGDIQMLPLMLGWKHGDFKWQGQFGVYAPTGAFKKGELANIGRNYWTFAPAAAVSYLSSKFGLEITTFVGLDFNTKNNTTDYQTGDQFHLDGTIAEHLPFLGGFVGGGVNGYFYQQITGDSGSGARLGGFEGMTTGVGPAFSYAYQIGNLDLASEVKWLPELAIDNRLNGNTVWFKIGLSYAAKPAAPLPGL